MGVRGNQVITNTGFLYKYKGYHCCKSFSKVNLSEANLQLKLDVILETKRKLVALLLLSRRYIVTCTINVLWLFLTVPWVGLQYVIVVFSVHTHLLFVVIIWQTVT